MADTFNTPLVYSMYSLQASSHVSGGTRRNRGNCWTPFSMSRTLNFLAPSLHPNTLLDIAYPEPGPSSREPIVRYLAVKHGEYLPLGHIKRMVSALDNNVCWSARPLILSAETAASGHSSGRCFPGIDPLARISKRADTTGSDLSVQRKSTGRPHMGRPEPRPRVRTNLLLASI